MINIEIQEGLNPVAVLNTRPNNLESELVAIAQVATDLINGLISGKEFVISEIDPTDVAFDLEPEVAPVTEPEAPAIEEAPETPTAPETPEAPTAPETPEVAPVTEPEAPAIEEAPETPEAPTA